MSATNAIRALSSLRGSVKWMGALAGGAAVGGAVSSALYSAPEYRKKLTSSGAKAGLVAGTALALGIHGRKEVGMAAVAAARYVFRRVNGRVIRIKAI